MNDITAKHTILSSTNLFTVRRPSSLYSYVTTTQARPCSVPPLVMSKQPSLYELQKPADIKDVLSKQEKEYFDCTPCRLMGQFASVRCDMNTWSDGSATFRQRRLHRPRDLFVWLRYAPTPRTRAGDPEGELSIWARSAERKYLLAVGLAGRVRRV